MPTYPTPAQLEAARTFRNKEQHAAAAFAADALYESGIPMAVAGGMAMQAYGVLREASDVDILVPAIHRDTAMKTLRACGYFTHGKFPHTCSYGADVVIDVFAGGVWMSDRHPMPLPLPTTLLRTVQYVSLEQMLEIKLSVYASDNERHVKHYEDVRALINVHSLPERLDLDERVARLYGDIWQATVGAS